ncbi:MAG: nickel pincer cofactor biosynthesis protein LarB [Candidatus Thermoplasmatota archaeon]|nr:nickel pincer cofactor biosynthesis protein LarB [Candidatus Thermoplasmatota archaeon]
MDDILEKLHRAEITLDEARSEVAKRLLGSLEHNIDPGRELRTGIPEVILSEGKTLEQIFDISSEFLRRSGRAIISRITPEDASVLERRIGPEVIVRREDDARILVLRRLDMPPSKEKNGRIAILTAGTSDIPAAEEARIIAEELGCETLAFHDVGAAGIHRLVEPLKRIREFDPDVIIVAAGREGALPTIVSGLTEAPVIGLPVSTGYGIHPKGETALFAMLQSCSPLLVVNIDAGIVAGMVASRIARRRGKSKG